MLDISGKHACFRCGHDIPWKIYHKEAVAPYVESGGMMRISHSGQAAVHRLEDVRRYAFLDKNLLSIDLHCSKCDEVNRINYQLDGED